MKKLGIALAIAIAAACGNAASVQWSMSSITDSPDAAKAAGWAAYFMDASTYDAFTALTGDAVASYVTDKALYSSASKNNRGQIIVQQTDGNYAIGDTISGYMVLFDASSASDAKNYAYTAVNNGTVGDAGANVTMNFGTFASATSATGGWTTTAVPEPTSGLLMLLGMAGLALRRRRV